jgi:hypothetical protein
MTNKRRTNYLRIRKLKSSIGKGGISLARSGATQPKKGCLLAAINEIVVVMNAIETTGIVDARHQLLLDEPLPIAGHSRVRVIVLVPEETDISEAAWIKAAASSPTFHFLKDAAEDIYTVADGKPFHDEG